MTLLQKTSALLLGLVFCFGANVPVFALAEEFCRCTVTLENEDYCPSMTHAENIEFDFSENRNLSWIIQTYAAEPNACKVSNFRVNRNLITGSVVRRALFVEGSGLLIPEYVTCLSPIGMSQSSILNTIGRDTNIDVNDWTLLDKWNVETVISKSVTSATSCNDFSLSQDFGEKEILCYEEVDNLFALRTGNIDPQWRLRINCGSATKEYGSGTDQVLGLNNAPAYEPIAWSFPTDKINALNKTGISGTGTTQVQLLIGRLIKYAVGFLGSLGLCLVIYAGVRFMLSSGEEDQQKESLNMMLWAGIGITALLGAYSIVSFVLGILK